MASWGESGCPIRAARGLRVYSRTVPAGGICSSLKALREAIGSRFARRSGAGCVCSASLGYCQKAIARRRGTAAAPPAHRHGAASQPAPNSTRRRAGSAEAGLDGDKCRRASGLGDGRRQHALRGPRRAWEDAPRGAHAGAARRGGGVRAGLASADAGARCRRRRARGAGVFVDGVLRRRGRYAVAAHALFHGERDLLRDGELAGRAEPAAPATTAVAAYTPRAAGVRSGLGPRVVPARPPEASGIGPARARRRPRGQAAHVNTRIRAAA